MKNIEKPEISILLATYNGEKYIPDLLDSLEKQKYSFWNLIVLDDCSTDSTVEIIRNHNINLSHRVSITRNDENLGGKSSFLKLLRICKCDYALLCDQDDVWDFDKIEELVQAVLNIEKQNGKSTPIMVHCDMSVVDGDLNMLDESFYHYAKYPKDGSLKLQMCMNEIPGCTMLINKALMDLCAYSVDPSQIIMHDSWIALVAFTFGIVRFVDKPLMMYRQHTNNTVGAANARHLHYQIKRLLDRKRLKDENRQHIDEVAHFYSVYEQKIEDELTKKMLQEYSKLKTRSIFAYLYVCIKYRIFKFPVSRAIFQLISGCNI